MRKLLLTVALGTTMLATPAMARDNSFYVGLEGGVMKMDETDFDFSDQLLDVNEAHRLDHKTWGWDVDVLAGYDLGMIRVEGELAYKRVSTDEVEFHPAIIGGTGAQFEADGRSTALSVMLNALLDFGNEGLGGYLGGGIGLAKVKHSFDIAGINQDFRATDSGLAWQAIAGLRFGVSENMDVGLKYRFFNVPNVEFNGTGPNGAFESESRWRSHSLLLSLIYNFGPPAVAAPAYVPPPPPPPPPATRTCPDGTVVLATEPCPAPPPPPPPPPPAPERG